MTRLAYPGAELDRASAPSQWLRIFRQLRFVARADDEARDGGTLKEPIERDLSHRFPCLAAISSIASMMVKRCRPHERTVSGPQAARCAEARIRPPDLAVRRRTPRAPDDRAAPLVEPEGHEFTLDSAVGQQ